MVVVFACLFVTALLWLSLTLIGDNEVISQTTNSATSIVSIPGQLSTALLISVYHFIFKFL